MQRTWQFLAIAVLLVSAAVSWAQDSSQEQGTSPVDALSESEDLSVEQARLADRYERLEQVLGQLAELSAAADPNRARLLRAAIARSREEDIQTQFESIVKLLEDERLSAAANNQTELRAELDELLNLLLKADRDKELESERDRFRKYLKEVTRLLRSQKSVRARTESGEDVQRLADDQQRIAGDTGKLCENIAASEHKADDQDQSGNPESGKNKKKNDDQQPNDGNSSPNGVPPNTTPPSDSSRSPNGEKSDSRPQQGPPNAPTDRAAERLKNAQQQMQQAHEKLEEAERGGAAEKQREAVAQLERAKAELERVLRQLREEEMERMLTQLAVRFRKMLELQNAVYEGTQRLDRIPSVERGHDEEIEAARLSGQESEIVREADKATVLLREEGSSVAFPEAIEQMRDDMQQVVERLSAVKTDEITQGLEKDIIAALEETIAALEKAIKDLEKGRSPPNQQPVADQPPEPPLVDKIAELKMIRALQMRINQRTQRYAKIVASGAENTSDLRNAMRDLAERQRRVYRATYDLSQGLND